VIRPKRELPRLPSEQALAIGLVAAIFLLLLVVVVVTW
jgi:hypothetical protein